MRGLRLGLSLGRGQAGTPAPFNVSLTGLSTDSIGTYGQIGNHANISYLVNGSAPDTYAVAGFSPPLVADFVNETYRVDGSASDFASMFTFARTSTATYVDSSGVLQTASSGTARVGHHVWNGSAWVNEGLLLESEARTNLITQSDFASGWLSFNATNSNGVITEAAGGAGQSVYATIASTAGPVTFSCTLEAGARTYGVMSVSGAGATDWGSAVFDLSTGTVTQTAAGAGSGSVVSTSVVDEGGGKYRCSVTVTGFTALYVYIGPAISGTPSYGSYGVATYSGDGTSGITASKAQLEAGSTPSSYIPTAGAAVTRTAETLTIAAANMPYSATAMSMQLDGRITYADEGTAAQQTFARWYADANNYIVLDLDTDSTATGEVNAEQAVSGTVDGVAFGTNYTPGVNVAFNIASRHTSGAINVAKDGTAGTEDATPTALPNLAATNFSLGHDMTGTIGKFRVWDADLGDAGIEEASA